MSTSSPAPRLLRAIAETTQPYGPLLEGRALHTLEVMECLDLDYPTPAVFDGPTLAVLQEYLSDVSQVDIVYMTVLNRASGEPLRFVLAWPKLGSVTKVQHNTVLYRAVWQWWRSVLRCSSAICQGMPIYLNFGWEQACATCLLERSTCYASQADASV